MGVTSEHGKLLRLFEKPDVDKRYLQLIVPRSLRQKVLSELHNSPTGGHVGEDKLYSRLQQRFYWPGYSADVKRWCATCPSCAARKSPTPHNQAPLQTVAAGSPMQIVAVDILGPLPESLSKNRYVLVAMDYFTRWAEAYTLPNQEAITVATKLVNELFLRFSIPEQLHSDQGRQFESRLMSEICSVLGIRKSHTTPYHPQSDGLVERFNRTLLNMPSICCQDCPFAWEDQLPKVCVAYNTSIQHSTGFTPFYLMFGREARLPVDLMYGSCPDEPNTPATYASQL